jgi:uncharacterized membrane protein YiaA
LGCNIALRLDTIGLALRRRIHANTKTSGAFIAASWVAVAVGLVGFLYGIWNAKIQLNEKGFYLVTILYGLFAAVSVQKNVRDRLEGIPVTGIYYGLAWASLFIAIAMLVIGLWNAALADSKKGFYGMAFLLALFGAVAVQKNTRDASSNSYRE